MASKREPRNMMRPQEMPTFEPAQTITATHIQIAYGFGNNSRKIRRYHRKRIEEYGRSNREFLRSLIVHEPAA